MQIWHVKVQALATLSCSPHLPLPPHPTTQEKNQHFKGIRMAEYVIEFIEYDTLFRIIMTYYHLHTSH